MTRYVLCAAILLSALIHPLRAMTPEERKLYLEQLLKTLPAVPSFQQWLDKTHEIPPDFDAFPKINGLPDPLRFLDGRLVRTAAEWKTRRAEIRQLLEKYDTGSFPPKPKLDRAVVQSAAVLDFRQVEIDQRAVRVERERALEVLARVVQRVDGLARQRDLDQRAEVVRIGQPAAEKGLQVGLRLCP